MHQRLGAALSYIPDFACPPKYWPSEKDPQPKPEELPRFYMIKTCGDVIKTQLLEPSCERWSVNDQKWKEESESHLNGLIEDGFVMELQYPFRGVSQ